MACCRRCGSSRCASRATRPSPTCSPTARNATSKPRCHGRHARAGAGRAEDRQPARHRVNGVGLAHAGSGVRRNHYLSELIFIDPRRQTMTRSFKLPRRSMLLALACTLVGTTALAQDPFPSKSIRIVAAGAPGRRHGSAGARDRRPQAAHAEAARDCRQPPRRQRRDRGQRGAERTGRRLHAAADGRLVHRHEPGHRQEAGL